MRLCLYFASVLGLSVLGALWTVVVQTAALNAVGSSDLSPEGLVFVALFGAAFTLPFVALYLVIFVGLFIGLRALPVAGLIAGVGASAVSFALFLVASRAVASAAGSVRDVAPDLFAGVVIVAWCGFAGEMVHPIVRHPDRGAP